MTVPTTGPLGSPPDTPAGCPPGTPAVGLLTSGQADRGRRRSAGRLPEALAGVTGLAVWGWQVGTPSPWLDEADTLVISRRGVTDIVALVRHVDLVHSAFYLLAHLVIQVIGPITRRTDDQLTAVRLISVIAMAGTGAVLVRLGRRLGSVEIGLAAAAGLLASPLATRWGQDARPFALATLLAAIATLVLVTATASPERSRLWAGYLLCLCLLGLVDVLALLLVCAHAVYLMLTGSAATFRRWLAATAAAGVLIAPFALLAFGQRGQVSWLTPPHLYDLTSYYILAFGTKLVPLLIIVAGVAVLLRARGLPGGATGHAFALGVAWAAVPPLLLWAVSSRLPLWSVHYVLFTLPGLALLLAAELAALSSLGRGTRRAHRSGEGLTTLGAVVTVVVLTALAVQALPAQARYRARATGHNEDVRGTAGYVAAHARRGDAVLFVPYTLRDIRTLYPESFAGLDDVAMAADPTTAGSISGLDRDPAQIPAALAGRPRVWLVTGRFDGFTAAQAVDQRKLAVLDAGYREVGRADLSRFTIVQYQAAPQAPHP